MPSETKEVISNIGESIFENRGLGVKMTVWDAAHPTRDIFYRVFDIKNISKSPKMFRAFSTHNYNILENPHYDQFAVGTADWHGFDGTWMDMENDGILSGNMVSQGSVDSTIGWTLPQLWPGESTRIKYWIAIGRSYKSVRKTHKWALDKSTTTIYHNVFNFWHSWLERTSVLLKCKQTEKLPKGVMDMFYRSLLTVISHMDITGSVIASCDSDIKQFGADLYTYCWPRDAAWAAIALDRAKYHDLSIEIFDFFSKVITDRGYFLHKYTPRGDFGSTCALCCISSLA
jgi:GH15 family glucan-1,4-alpha-glucosidase